MGNSIFDALCYVNFLAVAVATLAYFAVGAFWYMPQSPIGKIWMRESKLPEESFNRNMALIFGTTFVITFVICTVEAVLLLGVTKIPDMLQIVAMVGIGISAMTVGMNYLYQGKSLTLWIIDAGYQLTGMIAAGLILALWK